jgi:hypothetical protein
MKQFIAVACVAVFSSLTYADQGGLISSPGGSLAAIAIANPPGTLSIIPPSLTFTSTDGSTLINATFSTNKTVESCSGGGKGGHVTCSYTFTGGFTGTLTVNGSAQAINGTTTQYYGSTGILSGATGYNSAYTPFYFTDGNARILRADDLSGDNAVVYGTQGTGAGQFYGPSGIALDSFGRIYITDTYNDRLVRMDDMNGTNWVSFGTYGSGVGQFDIPQSVSIDPSGHIWVLDNGNGRLIRMDDMNGTDWTVVGSAGSGVGQFSSLSSAPGFDSLGRIYVADAGNHWIVRFDDLNFTNWTTLSQSQPVGPYIYQFGGPTAVGTDQAGKIYVADGTNIIRVDDMTGVNWTSISVGKFPPHTLAVDSSGMVLLGNGYNAQVVDSEATVLTSNITVLVQGVYVSVYGAVPISLPTPRPSAVSLTPPGLSFSQNVGTTSPAQTITIANFGGSPLSGLNTVAVSGGFAQTNNCPAMLTGGSNCTVSVTFTPTVTGTVAGALTVSDDSGNLGTAQTIPLSGTGTTPAATVTPTSLSFSSQVLGTSSTARTVTVQSSGTGPLQITNVAVTGPFSQTNNCSSALAPAASCSISVVFSPTVVGSASGILTITDDAGSQTVAVTGNGTSPVSLSSSSLSFGSLAVGNTSAAKTITATNRLSTALTFTNIGVTGPFAIASNTCGTSLAAGASCTVGVTFSPTALGSAAGALSFADSAINSPQTVNLSGTGTAPVTLSTSSISFGTVAVGSTSSAKSVTLTNAQSVALTFTSIGVTGPFAISNNTCGASINAGARCTVSLTFTPTATGSATGTLTFSDSAPNSPQAVGLSGSGGSTTSPVTLSASSLNFGSVTVGTSSSAMTVTLTNRQSVGLTFNSIGITGAFAISSNTCGSGIAAGAACSVGVTFSPTTTGSASGTLSFADNATNSPQKVTLSGTGAAPVAVSPTSLNFGVVAVGSVSAGQTVTVSNKSASAVAVNSISFSGDFSDATTCAASLPAGSNCTINVRFAPTTGGTRTGTLTVSLSTGALTVSLTGTGSSTSQTPLLTLSPTSITFNNGYTIGDNPSQSITVTNSTAGAVGIASIGINGDPSLTETTTCGATVAAGGSCSIRVTFRPVAYGTFTATVTLTEGSGALDTVSVTAVSSVNN